MTANRHEKRDARAIQEHLDISYVHALRLLREQAYVVRDGQVAKGPGDAKPTTSQE
jgi:hypothetical protein